MAQLHATANAVLLALLFSTILHYQICYLSINISTGGSCSTNAYKKKEPQEVIVVISGLFMSYNSCVQLF